MRGSAPRTLSRQGRPPRHSRSLPGGTPGASGRASTTDRGEERIAPPASRSSRGRRHRAGSTTSTGTGPTPTRYGSTGRPRSEDQLTDVLDPAVDVAADIVRVVRLHARRPMRGPGEDAVAEARREAFDLGLDPVRHVDRASPPARGSTPTRQLCPRARARDPRAGTGRRGRTADRGCGRRRHRTRPRRSRRASRRGGQSRLAEDRPLSTARAPSSAQSTLKTPGPYRNRSARRRIRGASAASPAIVE